MCIGPTRGLQQTERGEEVFDVITLGSITAYDEFSPPCDAAVVTGAATHGGDGARIFGAFASR